MPGFEYKVGGYLVLTKTALTAVLPMGRKAG